jgi:ELWxxDGT repeat protein
MRSLLFFTLLLPALVQAQLTLVTDLNSGAEDGFDCFNCIDQVSVKTGLGILTVATSADNGKELMLISEGELTLVKDINPGSDDGRIDFIREREGLVYFSAKEPTNGSAVWVTDGTEAGTTMFFDPDPTNESRNITGFEFGADGALYVVLQDELFRLADGETTMLAEDVALSASNDNFPGTGITPYQTGVAFFSNEDNFFGGGLFLATDTLRQLGAIDGLSDFDQGFGLREVNGNLVFSLNSTREARIGSYVYDAVADTLTRYLTADDEGFFISRWYPMTDSLELGLIDGDYYSFDGLNEPALFFDGAGITTTARQRIPSLKVDSLLFLQTDGGIFNDSRLVVTNGTVEGTATIVEGNQVRTVSNLVTAGGYVFFATRAGTRGPIPFYRYEIATGELEEIFEAPEREDNRSYNLQLIGVRDGLLYLSVLADTEIGRELYSIDPGVEIVSVFGGQRAPELELKMTSETFTVVAEGFGNAELSIFNLNGRLLEQRKVAVNATQTLPVFSGLRVYYFTYEGKVAVRKVVGGR